jgi:hypothetical protein
MLVRVRPGSTHAPTHAGAALWVLMFLMMGCNDQPAAPAGDEDADIPATEFTISAQAVAAARTARIVGLHRLATLSTRSAASQFMADETRKVNSPFDLTYFGGQVLHAATSYNVYVNCPTTPAACWGTGSLSPRNVLKDLNFSDFIRLVNEYIGSDARKQFPVKELKTSATFGTPESAILEEIFQIVFSAVEKTGATGYDAMYHVFLPQGTSMCIDEFTCYSPDNPDNFVFCAFHGSVDFSETEHVLFSVEPYQGVPGCQIPGQTPHGTIDATASTLSHELMETITNPDGDGWFNLLFGLEMADICFAFATNRNVNGHDYFLQSEWSNKRHACTNGV